MIGLGHNENSNKQNLSLTDSFAVSESSDQYRVVIDGRRLPDSYFHSSLRKFDSPVL
jgi:hypothetical protein